MYVSPNHPDPPRQAAPPTDGGLRLATIERPRSEELRISIDQFNGYRFLRLAVWFTDQDGRQWPVRGKQVTLSPRSIPEAIKALREAEAILERGHVAPPPEDDGRPRFVERRRRPGRFDPRDLQGMPATPAGDGNRFDEFQERP